MLTRRQAKAARKGQWTGSFAVLQAQGDDVVLHQILPFVFPKPPAKASDLTCLAAVSSMGQEVGGCLTCLSLQLFTA